MSSDARHKNRCGTSLLNIQDLDFGDFFDEFLWMSHKVWLCYYVVEAYSRSN